MRSNWKEVKDGVSSKGIIFGRLGRRRSRRLKITDFIFIHNYSELSFKIIRITITLNSTEKF